MSSPLASILMHRRRVSKREQQRRHAGSPQKSFEPKHGEVEARTVESTTGYPTSQAPSFRFNAPPVRAKNGATNGTRTRDPQIHNLVL